MSWEIIKRYRWVIFLFFLSILTGSTVAVFEPAAVFFFSKGIYLLAGILSLLFIIAVTGWLIFKKPAGSRDPLLSLQRQGTAFLAWFAAHNLFWAVTAVYISLGLSLFFGFRLWIVVLSTGTISCTFFALTGALLFHRRQMLGLCWQSNVPDGLKNFWAKAGAGLILWERYEIAAEKDQQQPTPVLWSISRIFNREKSGGADRALDLLVPRRNFISRQFKKERHHRLLVLAVLFSITVILSALPGLLGLTPHHWDRVPDGWPFAKLNRLKKTNPHRSPTKPESKESDRQKDTKGSGSNKTESDQQKKSQSNASDNKSKSGTGSQTGDTSSQNNSAQKQEESSETGNENANETGAENNRKDPSKQESSQSPKGKDGKDGKDGSSSDQGKNRDQSQESREKMSQDKSKDGQGDQQDSPTGDSNNSDSPENNRSEQKKNDTGGSEQSKQPEQKENSNKNNRPIKKQDTGSPQPNNGNDGQKGDGGGMAGKNQDKSSNAQDGKQGQGQGQGDKDSGNQGKESSGSSSPQKKKDSQKGSGSSENNPNKENKEKSSGGKGKGKGDGQGSGSPDDIPEMLSNPETLPKIPSRSTGMVTLELPTFQDRKNRNADPSENQEKDKPQKKIARPGKAGELRNAPNKKGKQEQKTAKPEQYLPNWILNLIKNTDKKKHRHKS